jgi:hypothetical protein
MDIVFWSKNLKGRNHFRKIGWDSSGSGEGPIAECGISSVAKRILASQDGLCSM